MPQPMDDEALEKVGTPEERAVERRRAADDHMIAPARSGMLAVDHELVGAEPRQPRFLVDRLGGRDAFAPARRGMDVDFDDARVRRDANDVEARIGQGARSPRSAPAARPFRPPPPPRRRVRDSPRAARPAAGTRISVRRAPRPSPRCERPRRYRRAAARRAPAARLRRGERGDPLSALRGRHGNPAAARAARSDRPRRHKGRTRAEYRAARPAAGGNRPDCRREPDAARRGASSIFRCASAVLRPSPASAGPAARIRKARSGRAKRRGRCDGAPRGPSVLSSPARRSRGDWPPSRSTRPDPRRPA